MFFVIIRQLVTARLGRMKDKKMSPSDIRETDKSKQWDSEFLSKEKLIKDFSFFDLR